MPPTKARVGKAELKSTEPNKKSADFLMFAVNILELFLGSQNSSCGFNLDSTSTMEIREILVNPFAFQKKINSG